MLMKFLQFLFEQTIHVCYMYMQLFFEEEEGERERELIALVISTYMYIVLLLSSSLSSLCHFMMTAVHVCASVCYNFVLTSLSYLH